MRIHLSFGRGLLALLLVLTIIAGVGCQQSPIQQALTQEASQYSFSLIGWHLQNLPIKLVEFASQARMIPAEDEEEQRRLLEDFLAIRGELRRLQGQLDREIALHGATTSEAAELQDLVELARARYNASARQAETIIERRITCVLADEGLAITFDSLQIAFPPVLFVLQHPPNLLVVSPRDRVERLGDMLLSPDLRAEDMEAIEDALCDKHGLSAIVVPLGGVATYPSIVSYDMDLYHSVSVAAHEWTHQHLALYPLGRTYFRGGVMQEVNEAIADIVGREVADSLCRFLDEEEPLAADGTAEDEPTFDYAAEMRVTRVALDTLLDEGKVAEAESYLEERRVSFVQEGYPIRKLNQAYFAFYGTYATSPASVSPVGDQLHELRSYYTGLGDFVTAVRLLTTYDGLLDLLAEKRLE